MLRQTIAMSFLSNDLKASTIAGASGSQSPAPSSVSVLTSRTMMSAASPRASKSMLALNHSSFLTSELCCSSSHLEQEDGFVGTDPNVAPAPPWILVFSGGTAFNGVVEDLKKFTTHVTHVLPVSDDGGSTAEIVRVLGGPAVGDIRSRCLRLSDESSIEALAVKKLLGHRLPLDSQQAKSEWYTIVEGENSLWDGVSGPYRETIRAFLVYFQSQILSHSNEKFCFSNGSIGNFFFAGARLFFQSLEAAIFLFSRVSQIPTDSCVLPVVCTNDRLTLGCELMDGSIIRGQNEISHPYRTSSERTSHSVDKVLQPSGILPAPVKRIFYMSSEGTNLLHEVFPAVNPTVLEHLKQVNAIVYGMGSLFTSICPSLVLCGVGEVIAQRECLKILILNGTHDRETFGMSASDFIISLCDALNRKYGKPENGLDNLATSYVNCILVPRGGSVRLDLDRVHGLGIERVVSVDSTVDDKGRTIYEPKALIMALARLMDCDFSC